MLVRLRRGLLLCAFLVFVAACQLFDSPEYTDEAGVKHEAVKGIISQVAKATGTVELPYFGIAGSALGIIGALGTYLTRRRGQKNDQAKVHLLDELKAKAAELKSDKDVEDIVNAFAEKNPKFGKHLKKAWHKVRSAT